MPAKEIEDEIGVVTWKGGMKKIPRLKIIVTSSLNEISTEKTT